MTQCVAERKHGETIQRLLRAVREKGDRLTGGGVRCLAKRISAALLRMSAPSLRRMMSHPGLVAVGRAALKPFPRFGTRLFQLAIDLDIVVTIDDIPASARRFYVNLKNAVPARDASIRRP